MEPTHKNGEFIAANLLAYVIGDPSRGDVAIVRPNVDNGRTYYVERVIGLPGDEVRLENGKVFLKKAGDTDFSVLSEPYLSASEQDRTFPERTSNDTVFKVPE